MNERNPRSKLNSMKRLYFFSTMAVYLLLFLLAYLIAEILFMIFEAGPYTKLAFLIIFLLLDYILTDLIINRRLNDRWKRGAPDILDTFKAPEPAYIEDGPVQENASESTDTKKTDGRRLHRTQYQKLKEADASKETQSKQKPVLEEKKEMPEQQEHPEKKESLIQRIRNKLQRKHATAAEAEPEHADIISDQAESSNKKETSSKWMAGLDDMDTVEFADAVIKLEDRVVKQETQSNGNEPEKSVSKSKEKKAKNDLKGNSKSKK